MAIFRRRSAAENRPGSGIGRLPQHGDFGPIRARAREMANHFRLPWDRRNWHGASGLWGGAGIGSSVDFQDHRPYLPGDDPRYINWQAYARSGNYTMKLYREEVSPQVDLVMDVSASMGLSREKLARAWECFLFCAESAWQSTASLRAFGIDGGRLVEWSRDALLSGRPPLPGSGSEKTTPLAQAPALHKVPFRRGSLRVLVSDLLFPGIAREHFLPLAREHGMGLIFVPFDPAEAEPPWEGNLELVDCETGERELLLGSESLRARFRETYRNHFRLCRSISRQCQLSFARVSSAGTLVDALRADALPGGAIVSWV